MLVEFVLLMICKLLRYFHYYNHLHQLSYHHHPLHHYLYHCKYWRQKKIDLNFAWSMYGNGQLEEKLSRLRISEFVTLIN